MRFLPLVAILLLVSRSASAQEEPEPSPEPLLQPEPTPVASPPPPEEEARPVMSEGRTLVSLYNSGFNWGIAPGVVVRDGDAGFYLGVSIGYGVDLGPVIVVPGVRGAGYFTDPNVFLGMPTMKLVLPIDRFAPFVQGGIGFGHVARDSGEAIPAKSGVALSGGGGFMVHFPRIAFGAEAAYTVVTGTDFKGISVGPILALGF